VNNIKRYVQVLLLLALPALAYAQAPDSLFVVQDGAGWSIRHRVKPKETIFLLSRRYYAPPAVIAEANGKTYSDGLTTNAIVMIPTGPFNWLGLSPGSMSQIKPVYYKIEHGDRLYQIARQAGTSKKDLMARNSLLTDSPPPGRVLFVGWLKFDKSTIPADPLPQKPVLVKQQGKTLVPPQKKDTPKYVLPPVKDVAVLDDPPVPKLNPTLEDLWNEQTQSGASAITEKATAGFFNTGSSAAMYAFHNAAARGTIIRIRNLNNDKVIYVKVLGTLPNTKAFIGCTVGLTNAAKAALDVRDQKAFCEVSYAGY
jgi:LysM repeat protein